MTDPDIVGTEIEARLQMSKDRRLGFRISPPSRDPKQNLGLRELMVRRLTPGEKGVWRRSLRDELTASTYCEPCEKWFRFDKFPLEWQCDGCQRWYRVEFATYEEMEDDDGD
jgi:hypothetical protein